MANMTMTMADLKKLGRTEDRPAIERTQARDMESDQVSAAVYWSCEEVADFVEMLGFPQYRVGKNNSNSSRLMSSICSGMFSSK